MWHGAESMNKKALLKRLVSMCGFNSLSIKLFSKIVALKLASLSYTNITLLGGL